MDEILELLLPGNYTTGILNLVLREQEEQFIRARGTMLQILHRQVEHIKILHIKKKRFLKNIAEEMCKQATEEKSDIKKKRNKVFQCLCTTSMLHVSRSLGAGEAQVTRGPLIQVLL